MINGLWVTLLFGIIATRFRDIPPVVSSFMQLFFTMTPIIWTPDLLAGGEPGSTKYVVEQLAKLNPFYHFIEIFRAPLVGGGPELDALGRRRRHHRGRLDAWP